MNVEIIECKGSEVLARLEQLRNEYKNSSKYPFLIGDKEKSERMRNLTGFGETPPETVIAESLKVDVPRWFKERITELWDTSLDEEAEFDEAEWLGEWPSESPEPSQIISHCDIETGQELPIVYLGLVPLEEPWQLPAVVGFGGWNECPAPEIQCAVMRYWQKLYGAEIVSLSGDVIECQVNNPPRQRDAALALAWEQFWYCEDIVAQGVETVSNLAATLLNAHYWYFWWD